MELSDYQRLSRRTAEYPREAWLAYPALGLAGEAGEVAEHAKKAIRDDGALIAVSGWDGWSVPSHNEQMYGRLTHDVNVAHSGRLYSALSGAPLAVLEYHRMSLHAAAFASTRTHPDQDERPESDDEDDEPGHEAGPPKAWLALAGTDTRISLWTPYAPQSSS